VRPDALYGKNWTIERLWLRSISLPNDFSCAKFDTRGFRSDVLTAPHAGLASPATWLELSRQLPNLLHRWFEQRDMGPNFSSPSTSVSSRKLQSAKFTDDYMERTKLLDLEVHPHDTHLAWIKSIALIKIG
jgi:hypothetical protein